MSSGAVSVFLKVGLKVCERPETMVRLEVPSETVTFLAGGVYEEPVAQETRTAQSNRTDKTKVQTWR